ncbi:MAG: hypothetical protein VX321_06665, partial [Actinomycetota bacterium]|nr:hypothetical protein [Actinomycetota bacterium]
MDAPRRQAVRILAVSLLVLLGGSLLAPDSVQTWADTQPDGWRRSLATAWADPVGRLSRSLGVDRPLTATSDALDTADRGLPGTTLPPATRPTTTLIVPTTTTPPTSTTSQPPPTTSGAIASSSEGPSSTVTSTTSTTTTTTSSTPPPSVPSPTTTLAPRVASPEEPLRILALGDSLMLDLQYGLARVLGARDDVLLTGKGALGFGFTVPHWDWDEDVLTDYDLSVAQVLPEVIVMMIGANEFEGHVVEGEALPAG